MAVNLVTHRRGGKPGDITEATKRLKALVMRHGAEDLQLSTEIAGPDPGQWVLVIRFKDWESYGRGLAGATADPEFATTLGALDALSEITGRRLVAGVEL
jgi:hypothetical protein